MRTIRSGLSKSRGGLPLFRETQVPRRPDVDAKIKVSAVLLCLFVRIRLTDERDMVWNLPLGFE